MFSLLLFAILAALPCPQVSAASTTERAVLIDLYNSTTGANWTDNTNWLGDAGTECTWAGVTCDGDGNVIMLDLLSNNLSGTIPSSIGNLTNLQSLQLSNNQLTGGIPPELGSLTNLVGLYLDGNQLTGSIPPELGNLANLQTLYLLGNQLTGSIPAELGNMSKLQELALHYNQLTGSIPPELGNLTNLVNLTLSNNQLTGSIPAELGNLANLQTLELDHNQLTGSIPAELSNLSNLQILVLDDNQLTGSIPAELGNTPNLSIIYLNDNQLTGSIPVELGNLAKLSHIYLNNNQLTGGIPVELGNLANLYTLNLSSNQLTGNIPVELGNLKNLYTLNLSSNQLTGSIPAELGGMTTLAMLYLSNNQLTGSIPAELGNPANLQYLELQYNQLTGSIPDALGNPKNLSYLVLNNNQLTGSIPAALGNLTKLYGLYLSGNQLTGGIPVELGNLPILNRLDLSGNQLTGSIPAQLAYLTNLAAGIGLDIRYNALYTTDATLRDFLNSRQNGGDWESTQTVAPTGLSAGSATNSSITLTWTPIVYTGGTGGYRVLYSATAGGPYTLFGTTSSKSDSSVTVTGLNQATAYFFVIKTETDPCLANQNTVISDYSGEVSAATTGAHTITTSVFSGSGTISCSPNPVDYGLTSSCAVTPDSGYHITSISGCGGTDPGAQADSTPYSYTTADITADCTVTASFANTYTISFGSSGSGAMTCTPTSVSPGGSFQCSVVPASGYYLQSLIDNAVDVTSQVSNNQYSVTSVTADHTVNATFQQNSAVLRLSTGNSETWYATLQSAYNDASNGDGILTLATDFYTDLACNRNVVVSLQGGYGSDFYTVTGWTVLDGQLTISNGTVVIENLIIK